MPSPYNNVKKMICTIAKGIRGMEKMNPEHTFPAEGHFSTISINNRLGIELEMIAEEPYLITGWVNNY
jgi:flagellar assembly factor FliW